jgi:predicted porin
LHRANHAQSVVYWARAKQNKHRPSKIFLPACHKTLEILVKYAQLPDWGLADACVCLQASFSTLEKISMKKTLIAMAVVAASGAAFAQSSVTLYGRVDANVSKTTGSQTALRDGSETGAGGSRFGFKGTEDLGSGLKAAFAIETGVRADNAQTATNNVVGGRAAWAELSSAYGSVRAGRSTTLSNVQVDQYHAFATDYGQAAAGTIFNTNGTRVNNNVTISSPNMGGLVVSAARAFKETDTLNGSSAAANNPVSVRANYGAGPFAAGLVVAQKGTAGIKNIVQAGASYNFGMATALVSAESDGNQAGGKNAYAIGVKAPVGPATIRATIGQDKNGQGAANDKKLFALGADYALSKRTALYAVFSQVKQDSATYKTSRQASFGVGHNF